MEGAGEHGADQVQVPSLIGMAVRQARDAGHRAGVVVVSADLDGPPLGALTWPGVWTVTAQRPAATMVTFALSMRADGKKPKTTRTYSEAAIWLAQRHPAASWSDIKKPEIREHMAWLLANYSPAYASNQYRALQAFFRWLADEDEIPNPIIGMKPPVVPPKLVPVLGTGELDKLLATCTGKTVIALRDKAIIMMFASSGARLAETTGLRVTDIDLTMTSAIVAGKASKMRIIKFSPDAAVALPAT